MKYKIKLSQDKLSLSDTKQALLQRRLQGRGEASQLEPSAILKRRPEQLPLSFSQQQLFFLDQSELDSSTYNFSIAVRLRGVLNFSVLEKSINEIIRRHESLRTKFITVNSKPIQKILPELKLSIALEDLGGVSPTKGNEQIKILLNNESKKPFNLTQCPLLRVKLFRLSRITETEQDYVLFITMPHIITDGWSAAVFYKELTVLYVAYVQGRSSPLPELPIQYADFSLWQRLQLQPDVLTKMFSFWEQHLSGLDFNFELPTDRNRPAVQTYNGNDYKFSLTKDLSNNLTSLCQTNNVTLFATLFSAFNILLHRYTGEEHICVGTPVANRHYVGIEELIGYFVNVLALHTDITRNPKFISLVERTHEIMLDAQPNQEYPFGLLVKKLKPVRDPSFNPIFQIMFVLHNVPFDKVQIPGLEITPYTLENNISKFDLTLHATEVESGLQLSFEYNVDLFERTTIARMANHFTELLKNLVQAPDTRISDLQLLTAKENQQFISEFGRGYEFTSENVVHVYKDNSPQQLLKNEHSFINKALHVVFEEQVLLNSSAIAVLSACGQSLTYSELNSRSNQLAHYIRLRGVGAGSKVALCIDRKLEVIIGILGVLKAGGTYVPIDPKYPIKEIEYILGDANISLVLIKKDLLSKLPDIAMDKICIDTDWKMIKKQSDKNPQFSFSLDNAAYIIYTSGSTGKPKGVVISHRNLIHSTQARYSYYKSLPESYLLLSSFAFDSSVAGIFWTLTKGGKLCIPSDILSTDPAFLVDWINQERITHLLGLASFYNILLDYADLGQLASLKVVIVAGEVCSRTLVEQHYDQLPKTDIYNEYGPTEGTVWCTVYKIPQEFSFNSIPIGHAIPNAQVFLLDAYLNPVPIGISGEIYIGGEGVATQYLNQPGLTAEKFIPNPFNDTLGKRLYKTGDRARYQEDGSILFLGRNDNQIKIRGFRVELSEIETKLLSYTSIQDAVVIAHNTPAGSKQLIAYLITHLKKQSTDDISAIRFYLHDLLPEYMIPSRFIFLDTFPHTSNGKLDIKALSVINDKEYEVNMDVVPHTKLEKELEAIWKQVLEVEEISKNSNFFTIGGDSILSMQVVSRAKQQGIIIAPRQMFEYQTIETLAEVLDSNKEVWVDQGAVSGTVPMLSIQQWFFEQNFFNPNHWNQSVLLEVKNSVNPFILKDAMSRLLQHHDILRSRFSERNGFWEQTLLDNTENQIDVVSVDFTEVTDDQRPALLIEQASKWQRSLNLSNGSLVRVVWFNYGAGSNDRLLIIMHHLVVDAVSWRILLEDMSSLYQQTVDGCEIHLPKKTTSFKYWAESLVAYAQTKAPEDSLAYWLYTDWKKVKELPIDINGGVNTEESGETLSVLFDAQKTSVLLQKAQLIYGGQIQEILIASLVAVLTEWIEGALLLELEGHGRENIFDNTDVSRTVGWFTAIYPLLFELTPEQDSLKTFNLVKEKMHTIPNHGIDFGVMRYLNRNPILKKQIEAVPEPQVGFNYLGRVDQGVEVSSMFSLSLESSGYQKDLKAKRARLLVIDVSIVRGEMHIQWNYSRACHFRETIEHLANKLLVKLDAYYAECLKKDVPDPIVLIKTKQTEYLINLEKEAVLDASIKPIKNTGESTNISQNILLTGVTGFVGAFLLEELLDKFKGKIYCLIRAGSYQKAHDRIEKTLRQYKIHNPSKEQRIILVVGDLAKPLLGLSENRFNELSHQIDMIYHNGSATNLMLPYHAMKAPNVYGTCEILRLACTSKTKPVHYISTLSIFDDGSEPKIGCYPEYDLPTLKTRLTIGYSQSKLVAEHIIQIARKRGLPVTVYRLGAVTGHGESGAWNINDFHFQFLKACLDIGMFPLNIKRFQLMPVDYVSRAIISLSNNKSSYGANFHIFNPQSIALQDLITWVNRYGYKVEKVLPSVWLNAFFEHLSKNPEHPLHTLVGMMEAFIEQDHDKSSPYVCDTTLKLLKKVGITLPVVDEFIFDKSLDYMLGKSALVEVSNKPNEDIPTYE